MNILKETFSWLIHIFVAVLCGLSITAFILQPTKVRGSSMESTLHNNDHIIISKLIHTFSKEPDYGDIVVIDKRIKRKRTITDDLTDCFKYSSLSYFFNKNIEEIFWIKRVIGKSGDKLEFKEGIVYRNGIALSEPYIKEPMCFTSNEPLIVPENHVFVLGDNRNNSSDSRAIGPIPLDHIVGKYLIKF
ncbi:MAG: signal peptidase I [Clostridium sp.]|nr:signal peptidase I [Clostridium sp.]